MTRYQDKYHESGLAAQVDSIRKTAKRFDETTLAAADSIRDGEKRFLESTSDAEKRSAEAMFDAASAAAPHAPNLVRLLSNLDGLPATMQGARPELVNDTNIARIIDALRPIENELNSYLADPDAVRLTNALDTGLQNFHQALRRSFGYWQMGQDRDRDRDPEVVADLDLRPERRHTFASKLLGNLEDWVPGSVAELRGSLGSGTADDYSDIDICWVVPDDSFTEAVDTLGAALSRATAVLSLRTDPEFARSARRRLVFARLYGMPLFWRVDIDIRARLVAADALYDADNPEARSDTEWSRPASAIENAIAAIKAAVRGQTDAADSLIRRGFQRIGRNPEHTDDLADAITSLAAACATQESSLTNMAAEVHQVADRLLRPARPGNGSHPEP
jgi:predicted nucleotidyltransferase